MKIIIYLIITILIAISTWSQNKGDEYRNKGDLKKTVETYKLNYKEKPSDAGNIYNLACAYVLI